MNDVAFKLGLGEWVRCLQIEVEQVNPDEQCVWTKVRGRKRPCVFRKQPSRGAGGQSLTNNNDYRKHLLSDY